MEEEISTEELDEMRAFEDTLELPTEGKEGPLNFKGECAHGAPTDYLRSQVLDWQWTIMWKFKGCPYCGEPTTVGNRFLFNNLTHDKVEIPPLYDDWDIKKLAEQEGVQ